jgi:hypothetical protein
MEILSEYHRILIASLQKSHRNPLERPQKHHGNLQRKWHRELTIGLKWGSLTPIQPPNAKGARPHRFPQDLTRSFSSPWPHVGPCYQKGPLAGTRVLISLDIGLISPKSILNHPIHHKLKTQDSTQWISVMQNSDLDWFGTYIGPYVTRPRGFDCSTKHSASCWRTIPWSTNSVKW